MARDVDLKRRLELFGLVVTEVDGWRTRGADTLSIKGSVGHHTGGAAKGVQPSLGVVINGRSDLVGPLCNVHGPREESRRVNLVAAGRANHAGVGHFNGVTGNSSVGGLEEEHTGGPNELISPLRVERFCRVHAAMVYGKADASHVCMHWEWATPAGRKVDFVKTLIHADYLRTRVGRLLANPALPWPDYQSEEDDMPPRYELLVPNAGDNKGQVWLVGSTTREYIDAKPPVELSELEATWGVHKPINLVSWTRIVRDTVVVKSL